MWPGSAGTSRASYFEGQSPDERVAERLGSAAAVADVMAARADPEVVAASCELTGEAGQRLVVRVAGGFGPEAADGIAGDAVPGAVELGGSAVDEDEPGEVDRPDRVEERRRDGAYPRWLADRMSSRALRMNAATLVMESSSRCTLGRT